MATEGDKIRVAKAIFEYLVDKDIADDLHNGKWEDASPRMRQTFIQLVETWVMD